MQYNCCISLTVHVLAIRYSANYIVFVVHHEMSNKANLTFMVYYFSPAQTSYLFRLFFFPYQTLQIKLCSYLSSPQNPSHQLSICTHFHNNLSFC